MLQIIPRLICRKSEGRANVSIAISMSGYFLIPNRRLNFNLARREGPIRIVISKESELGDKFLCKCVFNYSKDHVEVEASSPTLKPPAPPTRGKS